MQGRRFRLWGFRSAGDLMRSTLGALEQELLDVVYRKGSASVRDVQAELPRPIAYTTVMTTLDRLYRKGLLSRTKASRMFVYTAIGSRPELETAIAADIVSELLSRDANIATSPLLSNLVDAVGDNDRLLLDELERLVREKRARLEKDGDDR